MEKHKFLPTLRISVISAIIIFMCASFLTGCNTGVKAGSEVNGSSSKNSAVSSETGQESTGGSAGTADESNKTAVKDQNNKTSGETETLVSPVTVLSEADESKAVKSEKKTATTTASHPDVTISENDDSAGVYDSGTPFINPLTGLPSDTDLSAARPVAIMINNLKASLPQIGIRNADVLYECLVEGGTTRLMMVVTDYADLGVIGSVRSSREYYLDFAANHDAIYVHAGGSDAAYTNIQNRKINNLDGVNMYLPSTFYRDQERMKTMSIEHTLMTTGQGIVSGIEYKGYRTTLKKGFKNPLNFVGYNETLSFTGGGDDALHVIIPYNSAQFPQYIYRASTNTYLRYQYNGLEHIDGETGEQLEFTNVIIIVCPHTNTGDVKNHIDVTTTGSGAGYYVTGGKYVSIKWSKSSEDTPIVYTYADGTPLKINCGKTMINVISSSVNSNLIFNYSE